MSLTLILGGVRSGKSAHAVRMAAARDQVTFIATAPRIDGDDDLDARIARHQHERPTTWRLIEAPLDLTAAVIDAGDQITIIDCLTLWVSNLMWRGDSDHEIETTAASTLEVVAARNAPTLVITNEVGLGVHPESALGRRFSEVLGRVNQTWMGAADQRLFMVAGHAVTLVEPSIDL